MSSNSQQTKSNLIKLFVKNFRNIAEQSFEFAKGVNLFVGDNGQGKTNCLEAINMSCSLRPLQSLKNLDLIKNDQEQAKIIAQFQGLVEFDLEVDIFVKGKRAKISNKAIKSAVSLCEKIPVVTFIPQELQMITGSASLRRKALDQAAATMFVEHFLAMKSYEKILRSKNYLLKSFPLDHAQLKIFNDMQINEGSKIIFYRLKALEKINNFFPQELEKILGNEIAANIFYKNNEEILHAHSEADLKAHLKNQSEKIFSQEIQRRVTLFGPHLDDIEFFLNQMNARRSCSRGQSRALVLAFKLAQMFSIKDVLKVLPIIILDDIVSELDDEKKQKLISLVSDLKMQSFFSATDEKFFVGQNNQAKIFRVKDGQILAGL